MKDLKKYFTMPGGLKKFQETSGILEDVSQLNIRQVIKLKYHAKNSLNLYKELLSNNKKRLKFNRYLRATIALCDKIQDERRRIAIEYYYSLPPEDRTPKNWNKYVAECSKGNSQRTKEVIKKPYKDNTHNLIPYQYKKIC